MDKLQVQRLQQDRPPDSIPPDAAHPPVRGAARAAHQRGLVHGACHTYVGQEAIAVGVCAHLRPDDVVFSTHRGHGHALAKGVPPRELMAELFGRATGCSRGRGGSMHLFAPEVGLMGTSGIVGPCILQAAGAGYSFKLLKTDRVAVAFFGDGAVNNGAFHEGLNLAGIWKLPVLFVCENNQFATEVPFAYAAGNPERGRPRRGLRHARRRGRRQRRRWRSTRRPARRCERARAGGGPTLLECKTYRTRPHAEGMGDFTYRTREEVEEWKARCPIAPAPRRSLLATACRPRRSWTRSTPRSQAEVEEAQRRAEASPWPDPATAATTSTPSRARQPEPRTPGRRALDHLYRRRRSKRWPRRWRPTRGIFVLGEGIGKRGGNFKTTAGLYDQYGPERLCDTPICERGFVGLACGAAMTGTRPVVDFMFADFVLDAVGEIVNQIAKMQYMSSGRLKMPVLLRGCIGIGHSAATHHSGSYYPMYAHFPGLRVVVPSTPYDAKGLLHHALRCDDPVLFLEHRELLSREGPGARRSLRDPVRPGGGRPRGTRRDGRGARARWCSRRCEAAEVLAGEGVSVEVIDPRTGRPARRRRRSSSRWRRPAGC